MKPVSIAADCIVSPLGFSTSENYKNIVEGKTGLTPWKKDSDTGGGYAASIMPPAWGSYETRFEMLCHRAVEGVVGSIDFSPERTLFILSTTKGNIELLDKGEENHRRIHLPATAAHIAAAYRWKHHLVVSNACISGVLALIVAKRLIDLGAYDHAVIVGADVITDFVMSGFESLHALSPNKCRPFDQKRDGINLGEAAAAIALTNTASLGKDSITLHGYGLSNDANHISGPSRTGEELAMAIRQALKSSSLNSADIDFISAHGTATIYNDEMEAKAFSQAELDQVPIHSLKGYFGHTLGAAGIVETILLSQSMLHDETIPTYGFENLGVSASIQVCATREARHMRTALKTASGFGGCNAALILKKYR
jgi:3-oxoacyl-[acyl-carrier-protein] synthase-1